MSSTRSASPASDHGSPEQLTPRSKIRALLATVDSSDDENTNPKSKTSPRKQALAAGGSPAPRAPSASQEDDGSEGESEDEIRPRGRMAARMLGSPTTTNTKSAAQSPKQDAPKTTQDNSGDVDMADASEDEDLPVNPRRLQRKAPRSPTPEATETAARSPSPGLFVSSPLQPSPSKPASDSENDLPALKSDRFKALVERKRQERLTREAAEEAKKAERRARQEKLASEISHLDSDDDHVRDITDDEGGRKLTQEVKPTRKASRKAIEEMNRETQRMQRSMQLAHEAKTRKKISKNSLFERFNFKPAGAPQEEELKTTSSSRPGTPNSDVEMKDAGTPPSSPPTKKAEAPAEPTAAVHDDDDVMPSTEKLLTAPPKLDKGKGKAVAEEKPEPKPRRQVRVRFPLQPTTVNHVSFDSDDELEVTRTESDKIKALFDRVPTKTQESKVNQTLRALAQLHSPGKSTGRNKKGPSGMTAGQLEASLYQKARRQAKVERERRLEMLKAQGVAVQTAEEREKEMQEVDDIVAKARAEAEEIMQQERADAKKNKGDGDEVDPLAWDDSEDEDFVDPEDPANEADAEIELSGSEDEEDVGEVEDAEAEESGMFDEAAVDASESETEEAQDEMAQPKAETQDQPEQQDEEEEARTASKKRRRNQTTVLSDDEDAVEATPKPKTQGTPTIPNSVTPGTITPGSVLRSAKKSFIPGLPVQGPAGLGLTQMFAGTMDDNSQASNGPAPTQSMMPDFDTFPDSNFSATAEGAENNVEPATQMETQPETQGVQFNFEQGSMHGFDSLMRDHVPNTQASEIMEPSQDVGLVQHTPLRERFIDASAPHSTVDTVVLGQEEAQESPLVRRGRLRRKIEGPIAEEELEPTAPVESVAFTAMKDAARKEKKKAAIEAFNRKKSAAKDMVEENAEESEDEYAGLGGYDGEDSDNESVASVKEMLDDAAGNDGDGGKIAAFYADRERANDEKQVEQLFKDITNGMLRRKRGADYDLSDSDDGGEARRKMKRRQFAKMQKALFSDERVKKMAENPGNQAFLRTMEDRGSDDDMDFLDFVEEPKEQESSQEASQIQAVVPDSQPLGENSQTKANPRRTKTGKKPANIGEVRQTLSNLLEDDREASVIPATEAGSDSEDELANKENHQPRRTSSGVIDRLSLKRQSSSNLSTFSTGRQAFTAQSSGSSFKVPALLRRATTNSFKSTPSTTANSSAGGFGDEAKIKKAAGKRSGVSALAARDSEQRKKIREGERRREEKKARGAERRVGVVGGLLGKGSFE